MSEQNDTPPTALEGSESAAPAPSSDSVASPPEAEVMPSLEELLRRAELQAAEHHDAWLRAKAVCGSCCTRL